LWAFWGAIEAFHEGWFSLSLMGNLAGVAAYLTPAAIFTMLGLLCVRFPRLGAVTMFMTGLLLGGWFISLRHGTISLGQWILTLAMGGFGGVVGLLWWFGRPAPRRLAWHLMWGLPLLVVIISGAEPVLRVTTRHGDGDRRERLIQGNGVSLTWAPQGPGWPREGVSWHEANDRCRRLSADGVTLADQPLDIWRLPTAEEIVRSLTRHGENAGGVYDATRYQGAYETRPDKESPLWDPHSPIIYWWSADEIDEMHALRVVYNGLVVPVQKDSAMGSQAFRAVRDPQ
jgi:hypothetical protein